MKKFVSLLCSIAMLFTICTSASATNVETTSEPANVAVMSVNDDGGIAPQAESKGLYYVEDANLSASPTSNDWYTIKVTPDKGATLRMWLKLDYGTLKIKAYSPWLMLTYNDSWSSSPTSDIILATKCTGDTYTIKLQTFDLVAHYSMLIYQN